MTQTTLDLSLLRIFSDNQPLWHLLTSSEQGSAAWHGQRQRTIGSSEAAAVLGSKISTTVKPAELRAKLRGEPRPPISAFLESLFAYGRAMEPVLLDEVQTRLQTMCLSTGIFVAKSERADGLCFSASLDGLLYTPPDADGVRAWCVLEIKARNGDNAGWGPENDLGTTVWCQVQHQMMVSGVRSAVVYSGARSGQRRAWRITYSQHYIDHIWKPRVDAFLDGIAARGLDEKVKECVSRTAKPLKALFLD